jgi:ppGpp synthetase/RelA/SpoT-type nucleotidyltranferase|tara:strand:+ start:317 stop:1651 length:1335 start_codon:yes stop_codon:yes gene_type:complete
MSFTKGDIKRLGERIVTSNGEVNADDLSLLQEFRTSFSQPLSDTFNKIITIKNNVRQSAIVAFRLKRISTIINKAIREPSMNLNRMGDIAGIRLILENDREVYQALELIQKQFEQSGRIRDYIKEPKKIGYRGVHIYIKDSIYDKLIEIQIRTSSHHNWSTLVEITDILHKTRLKELGYDSNPKFAQFHALMSSNKELTDNEADLVYEILNEYNFITDLSKLFRKNNKAVRVQWEQLSKKSKYFLIEASKTEVPNLKAFRNYEDAEKEYFKAYKENENTEIVLTAISKPSFQQICIAYANYILSYHTFVKDIEPIIKTLAIRALEEKKLPVFKKIFKTYEELQANLLLDIVFESIDLFTGESRNGTLVVKSMKTLSKSKEKLLRKRFNESVNKRTKNHKEFMEAVSEYAPKGYISKINFKLFLKKQDNRIDKFLKNQNIRFEVE